MKFSSDILLDAKLRRFYAFWCLKEAYIKLEGEALLASWLKELEFRHVRAPKPSGHASKGGRWGEMVDDIEIWFEGSLVDDAKIVLQAFESDYMMATAIKTTSSNLLAKPFRPKYGDVDLQRDVFRFADT